MSSYLRNDPSTLAVTHPFQAGSSVQACRLFILRRPHFFAATIMRPMPHIADLYEGFCDGDSQVRRFFAHPIWQDTQSEAALLLHYRASLAPENIYAGVPFFPCFDGGRP